MLKAIILDFNGVILDDEPLHFYAMREAVASVGVQLHREVYWDRYLPMDDVQCLEAICRDYGLSLSKEERKGILDDKVKIYNQLLQDRLPLFPGVVRFIKEASECYPLALASGARRMEIERILNSVGLTPYFTLIVSAEDFIKGKPHPESFLLVLDRLNEKLGQKPFPIQPWECLVIEDSVGSIRGARAAGMICLAVSNSYPSDLLRDANKVVASLEEVQIAGLQDLFQDISGYSKP